MNALVRPADGSNSPFPQSECTFHPYAGMFVARIPFDGAIETQIMTAIYVGGTLLVEISCGLFKWKEVELKFTVREASNENQEILLRATTPPCV